MRSFINDLRMKSQSADATYESISISEKLSRIPSIARSSSFACERGDFFSRGVSTEKVEKLRFMCFDAIRTEIKVTGIFD